VHHVGILYDHTHKCLYEPNKEFWETFLKVTTVQATAR